MVINIQDDILRLRAMGLLERLLQDQATGHNILWATDAYAHFGDGYQRGEEITTVRITGENSDLIKTRARKAMEQQSERTKQHAEVFTPLWIVKKMNDFADVQWFGRKDGIRKETENGHIYFSKHKHWKLYVKARRLEITCGEAPFLATRYDVETGEALPVEDRIGLLDRKLRAVSENAADIDEWKDWALRAAQSIYGYELQGDNLLIARVNILCTLEEHFTHRWRQKADKLWLEKLCRIIAWNLWQMDGIKGCVPLPPAPTEEQLTLFPKLYEQENLFGEIDHPPTPCRIYNWLGHQIIPYPTLREKGSEVMKFDYIIGNPPYQDETLGDNKGYAPPIYHLFLDESYRIGEKVELIHPARFLFNAGSTPKAWNEKMLNDPHLKVVRYEQDASAIFPNTSIMGGVAITYHDKGVEFGAIETFTAFQELNSILRKVESHHDHSITEIIFIQNRFDLDALYQDYPEYKDVIGSNGKDKRFRNNIFDKVKLFTDQPSHSSDIRVLGIQKNKRCWKYFPRAYFDLSHENIDFWKVLVPRANGSKAIGEAGATPIIGECLAAAPNEGYTQSFIGIGAFPKQEIAEAALKYIKSKFARTMLGVLKITQDNNKETWRYVPLQDFTPNSDIDWARSVPEIDQQLYAKYGLDETEIEFIESHVKEMA